MKRSVLIPVTLMVFACGAIPYLLRQGSPSHAWPQYLIGLAIAGLLVGLDLAITWSQEGDKHSQ